MIPLSALLIAWIAVVGFFLIFGLLSIIQLLRFGLASKTTYLSTILFIVVTSIVVLASIAYFFSVDWTETIQLFGSLGLIPTI